MVSRMETIESRMTKLEEKQEKAEMFDYETTVVVTNLPFERGEDLGKKIDLLVKDGLRVHGLRILRVLRLNSKTDRPGLVKVQLESLDEKIRLLKAKRNLGLTEKYRKIFIRSSQSHAERMAQHNMKMILSVNPDLNKNYRLTGNGKLIPKTNAPPSQKPFGYRPPDPFVPQNNSTPYVNRYSMSPYSEPPSVYLQ